MKIAVTRRIPKPAMDRLYNLGEVWLWPHDRAMSHAELLTEAVDADILASQLSDPIDRAVFEARPNLKLIAQFAVGFNNIDLESARNAGITITNTPGVLTDATADMAFTLLLSTARRIVEGDKIVRSGKFTGMAPEFHLGYDLRGKTLGIYGMGRIGSAVARRALPFGLKVIYNNRRPNREMEQETGAEYVSFEDLLARSDYLSINAPLTPETTHRFTAMEFGAMKTTSILINTGRGPIVKEADLAKALKNGDIGAAGLDVYEEEPAVHPDLPDLDNVVLAPHIGSATFEVRTRMGRMVADNIQAFLEGREPPNKVV